jgi:hypothetical protein
VTRESIATYFSVSANTIIPPPGAGDITISAALFRSETPSNTFVIIPDSRVDLTSTQALPNPPVGTALRGFRYNLNIKVRPETRLLLVFFVTGPVGVTGVIQGFAGAGVGIE